jgi:hypothetical protein
MLVCSIFALLGLAGLFPSFAGADERALPLYGETVVRIATVEEAATVLTARDAFARQLSKFDLQCRLQTDAPVTLDDWSKGVRQEILAWNPAETERIAASVARIRTGLARYRLPLPKTILLIRTTGKEEADAAYTRAHAIVLPTKLMGSLPARLDALLLHELFHILSRHDRDLRRALYKIVGFQVCEPIALPPSLADRKITNPDAPASDCYIELQLDDKKITATPILYASVKQFDPQQGGNLFRYLTFRLLVIAKQDGAWKAVFHGEQPAVIDPRKLPAYFEKIGKNTSYVIHPDEILADNFSYLIVGRAQLPTPRIIDEMQRVLAK